MSAAVPAKGKPEDAVDEDLQDMLAHVEYCGAELGKQSPLLQQPQSQLLLVDLGQL